MVYSILAYYFMKYEKYFMKCLDILLPGYIIVSMMMKVSRQRLSNQVYDILKDMIANYRFNPGTRVNVEQIAKEVGASRTPVWEAVHRLIQEGLLENIPNRGVFMVTLKPEQAIELYEVRDALEGLAARLAATNIDARVLKKMKKSIEEQAKVVEKQDLVGYSQLDYEFHALVYEASRNKTLQEMLQAVKNKMRPISMHITPILTDLYKDHLELLDALEKHDGQRAKAAFNRHNSHMIGLIEKSIGLDTWKEVYEDREKKAK
jgi:DNA-binding GntR family transcriptional regulator